MIIKNVKFTSKFCLGSMADKFDKNKFTKVSFKENEHDFLLDYIGVDKTEILNIHNYLMVNNNMKYWLH